MRNPTEAVVRLLISEVPVVGGALSTLVGLLWPDPTVDVWGDIRARVEKLVDQKISDEVYNNASDKLKGVKYTVELYTEVVGLPTSSHADIVSSFTGALDAALLCQPAMLDTKYNQAMAPLVAQFATLHLTLLRDAVLFGATWGWPADEVDLYYSGPHGLVQETTKYRTWVDVHSPYEPPPRKWNQYEGPWSGAWHDENEASQYIALNVADSVYLWPWLDPRRSGRPLSRPSREVYFGPLSANAFEPETAPVQVKLPDRSGSPPLSGLRVFGGDRIDGIQNRWGVEWGGRLGVPVGHGHGVDTDGGKATPGFGLDLTIDPANPIVEVTGGVGADTGGNLCQQALNQLEFVFADGTRQATSGYETGRLVSSSSPHHVLSQIYAAGSQNDGGLGCGAGFVVLGFRYMESYDHSDEYFNVWFQCDYDTSALTPVVSVVAPFENPEAHDKALMTMSGTVVAQYGTTVDLATFTRPDASTTSMRIRIDSTDDGRLRLNAYFGEGPGVAATAADQRSQSTPRTPQVHTVKSSGYNSPNWLRAEVKGPATPS